MDSDLIINLGTLFYISSILGYFYELIICYCYNQKIYSHGFLKGPWLPIYGLGAVLLTSLEKFRDNLPKIFFLSFFLAGCLEYAGGYFLLKVMKMRLWDYTGNFLNIDGLVCFLSAVTFGIGGILVVYVLYPEIKKWTKKINKENLKKCLAILSSVFIGDLVASILK